MPQKIRDFARDHSLVAFEELLGGITFDEFLAEYWQRKPYLCHPSEKIYEKYFTLVELDRLLTSTALPINQVNMGKRSIGIPQHLYRRGSYADPNAVLDFFAKGESVILRAMHLWCDGLAQLVEIASRVFEAGSTANVYLTPANGQSSTPHWDAHDIFVFQIAGEKVWDIHASKLPLPLPSYEFDSSIHPVGDKIDEMIIRAGDFAYIPRGMVHNPRAKTSSVHVALGVQILTVFDVLHKALSDIALENVEMRRSLVIDRTGLDTDESLKHVRQAMDLMQSDQKWLTAMKSLLHDKNTSRKQSAAYRIQWLFKEKNLAPTTMVRFAKGRDAYFDLHGDGSGGELRLGTKRFSFNEELRLAFERALTLQTFCPCDLPLETVDLQVAFVERLLDDGVLEIINEEPLIP